MNFLRRLFSRPRLEAELQAELRDHIERQVADYMDEGMSEADARRRARLEFGGVEQVKELCRDARGSRFVEHLAQDVGYAARLLRRNPGFATVAALTLALGIGANVSVFSVLDSLLLKPLPVRHAQELVAIWRVPHAEHFSFPQVQLLAGQRDLFTALCAFGSDIANVGTPDAVEPVSAAWVTGNFYETLGVSPLAGRLLHSADDRVGAPPVAVLTASYWSRRFAADPGIVGQAVVVDGVPVTIVGVTPRAFFGAVTGESADVTLPVSVRPQLQPRGGYLDDDSRWLRILARPRQGVSRDHMKAQLSSLWASHMRATLRPTVAEDVRNRMLASTLDVVPGTTGASSVRRTFRTPLLVAMALVGLVLLIACINVANLLLARAATRQRELALRLAIGAGRGRIAQQLLTESVLLALIGATAGVVVGFLGGGWLVHLIGSAPSGPDSLGTVALDMSFDWRMFTFASAVVVVTTLLFGVAPAMTAAKLAPMTAMNEGSSRIAGSRRGAGPALVIAQLALSVLVLVGAGLFTRTLYNLYTVDRGFRHNGVLVVEVDSRRAGYSGDAGSLFHREILAFARNLPGVAVASAASVTPLRGGGISLPVTINGQQASNEEVYLNNVGAGYFEALATPVIAGRAFTEADDTSGRPVVIVNEAFARGFLRGDPLAHQIATSRGGVNRQVVGVVRDAVYESLRQPPPPTVYVPFFQTFGRSGGDIGMTLVLYVRGSLDEVATRVREYLQPRLGGAPPRIRPMTMQVERSLARERLIAIIAVVFGALVLALAAIGIYGLLAYRVVRRTQEIGVRLALGAERVVVIRLVIGDALRLVALGALVGVPAAWALARLTSSLLFGLTPGDLTTHAGAVGVLLLTSVVAALVPAWRAMRVNPVVALRYE